MWLFPIGVVGDLPITALLQSFEPVTTDILKKDNLTMSRNQLNKSEAKATHLLVQVDGSFSLCQNIAK